MLRLRLDFVVCPRLLLLRLVLLLLWLRVARLLWHHLLLRWRLLLVWHSTGSLLHLSLPLLRLLDWLLRRLHDLLLLRLLLGEVLFLAKHRRWRLCRWLLEVALLLRLLP